MELGEVDHELTVLETKKETVFPHVICIIEIPKEHISKVHTENAVLLHNCLFLRSIILERLFGLKSFPYAECLCSRLYIEKDGVRIEIGDGYSVGPGHGLIVSKVRDNIRVNPIFDILLKLIKPYQIYMYKILNQL